MCSTIISLFCKDAPPKYVRIHRSWAFEWWSASSRKSETYCLSQEVQYFHDAKEILYKPIHIPTSLEKRILSS